MPERIVLMSSMLSSRLDTSSQQQARLPPDISDPITSLGNRRALDVACREEVVLPGRTAALRLNLDRFKAINDSLGEQIGDAVLRAVADRIRKAIDPHDRAFRLEGDEFVVIQVNKLQPMESTRLASRLVDLLGRSYLIAGNLINIGVSIGVALADNDHEKQTLLKHATLALSRAKTEHNTFCYFEPTMEERAQARHSMAADLRRALPLRELSLVYQPQVSLKSHDVTGFEALLRWHHPQRGLVSPADFIPLAEELGLIVPIGEWVIRSACREAASWAQKLNVAVNVSALQLKNPDLITTIQAAIADSALDPARLELEVTESVLIGDHKSALDILLKVRDMGVRVSMDDFGTGYSSLSYLRSFPFDKIKIDQSFMRGHQSDPSGMAIVSAIAALGKALGMSTTAEGVETAEQMERVTAAGCTDIQGYLISRPLPPDQIGSFLRSYQNQP
jgi:diguanylate cyclase (GGDEF)-like protein